MRGIHDFIKWFSYITMGILIVYAFNMLFYGLDSLPANTLWQILLSGALTTFVTFLFYPRELENASKSSGKAVFQILLHYFALSAVMIFCGHQFGWLSYSPSGILMMLISVALVYLIAFGIFYLTDLKQANKINQKLKEQYKDEE